MVGLAVLIHMPADRRLVVVVTAVAGVAAELVELAAAELAATAELAAAELAVVTAVAVVAE